MVESPIAHQFLHSTYTNRLPDGSDAVIISEYAHYADGHAEPKLHIERKPRRSFYLTKPQYRDYNEKREIEAIERLDRYTVYQCELEREVFKALNGYYPTGYTPLKELCASPYLYGADIQIETLIKASCRKTFDKTGLAPKPATVGFLDIERSMASGSAAEITIISLTHENKVYTAILSSAFFQLDAAENRHPGDLAVLKQLSSDILTPMIEQVLQSNKGLKRYRTTHFDYVYYIGQTEFALIQWIFARLHENKTSLVGVWNIIYDIPAILQVIKQAKVAPESVLCPPDLASVYHKAAYVYDDAKVSHPTDKWHWLYLTGYSQFYDAMALYARLRKVIHKESSYALDAVLENNGLGGKLHFTDLPDLDNLSKADWHRQMQRAHPYHYIVYNQWDVISLQLQEWKNSDAQSMLLLSENTSLAKFTKQTRKASDTLYTDWITKGYVLGTAGPDMKSPYDAEIGAVGGAVLNPLLLDYNGLNVLTEAPHHKTQLHAYVNDIDFTAQYPTATQAGNISKDTKLSTVLSITGPVVQQHHTAKTAVEALFCYVISPADNAVALGHEFFGLADFTTMLERFNQQKS